MGKIKKLSDQLIPKIAAGEIVDRPSSVVKELIDNSIDAKATEIIIEIKRAGKELIKIIDNGEGMDKEDLEKCFDSFTTSKIYKEEDLNNISTMGFRGEALSSIVSVSKVKITTKQKNSTEGYQIEISGGKRGKIKKASTIQGTTVEIEDLFFNIPARKKFLKSDQTEFQHIVELVEKFSISNKDINIKLIHNSKVILDLKKESNLKDRIQNIYGGNISKELIEVSNENEYLKLYGFIGAPKVSSYTSNHSLIFVNNRYIENKQILNTIKSAYGKLIENRAFPFFALFLELMPVLVNINIHPQKKEVRFWNDKDVLDFINNTIKESLENRLVTYETDYFGNEIKNDLRKANHHQFNTLKDATETWNIKGVDVKEDYEDVFQIDKTYIITQTKEGLVLIDQHAAHESILYEQYLNKYLEGSSVENNLIECNQVIEVTPSYKNLIANNIVLLHNNGFVLEEFGGNSFKVTQIPELFKEHNIKSLIEEILENSQQYKKVDEKSKQTIEFLACRGAIKAGELLTKEEMINLAKKLEDSKNYLTCPHGRPTKRIISIKELGKMFKRI